MRSSLSYVPPKPRGTAAATIPDRWGDHISRFRPQTTAMVGAGVRQARRRRATGMKIIPVIDLMDGLVVRARMGRRDLYRPITTPLSPTSEPIDVARGLRSVHPFDTLYVADLDAIQGRGDHDAVLRQLK